jgi:hypothetical protein
MGEVGSAIDASLPDLAPTRGPFSAVKSHATEGKRPRERADSGVPFCRSTAALRSSSPMIRNDIRSRHRHRIDARETAIPCEERPLARGIGF